MRRAILELYVLVSFALASFFPLEVCLFDFFLKSSIHLLVAILVLTFVHTSTDHATQSIILPNVLGQPDHSRNLHRRGAFKVMVTTGRRSGHGSVQILGTALLAGRLCGGNGIVVLEYCAGQMQLEVCWSRWCHHRGYRCAGQKHLRSRQCCIVRSKQSLLASRGLRGDYCAGQMQ